MVPVIAQHLTSPLAKVSRWSMYVHFYTATIHGNKGFEQKSSDFSKLSEHRKYDRLAFKKSLSHFPDITI